MFAVGSHELEDHLLGKIACPPPLILAESSVDNDLNELKEDVRVRSDKINPDFVMWKRTDKFIVSWLLASISESVFSNVSKCRYST